MDQNLGQSPDPEAYGWLISRTIYQLSKDHIQDKCFSYLPAGIIPFYVLMRDKVSRCEICWPVDQWPCG